MSDCQKRWGNIHASENDDFWVKVKESVALVYNRKDSEFWISGTFEHL